uniref:Uncharacterized protein n=1 Tax=Anguilla anguilla TaxID=7936 RepID=A0A0E9S3A3_ANGAN
MCTCSTTPQKRLPCAESPILVQPL